MLTCLTAERSSHSTRDVYGESFCGENSEIFYWESLGAHFALRSLLALLALPEYTEPLNQSLILIGIFESHY